MSITDTKIQRVVRRLVQKANRYAIWNDTATEYVAEPEIVGYSTKGNRIMRRVDRLVHQYY